MNRTISRLGATAAASLAVFAFATPAAQAAPTGGANQDCEAYCHVDDTPSLNGQDKAPHEAGSKGEADNKFPPGQAPDGTDHNNGYECDGNQGVGQGNPAHSRNCGAPS